MSVTCRYWVGSDTTGHVCGKPTDAPHNLAYCVKHFQVQVRRETKAAEKARATAARADAAWRARNASRLPQMRVQLERAKSELARRTSSATDDRAAYGGAMHRSISASQRGKLSDSNVARVVELQGIVKRLTADIARLTTNHTNGSDR